MRPVPICLKTIPSRGSSFEKMPSQTLPKKCVVCVCMCTMFVPQRSAGIDHKPKTKPQKQACCWFTSVQLSARAAPTTCIPSFLLYLHEGKPTKKRRSGEEVQAGLAHGRSAQAENSNHISRPRLLQVAVALVISRVGNIAPVHHILGVSDLPTLCDLAIFEPLVQRVPQA